MRQSKTSNPATSGGAALNISLGNRQKPASKNETEEPQKTPSDSPSATGENDVKTVDKIVPQKSMMVEIIPVKILKKEEKNETRESEEDRGREEIDPKEKEHLKQEFEVYYAHKLELIRKGEKDLVPSRRKKELTQEKKEAKLERRTNFFKHLMGGDRRNFWGTGYYTFLRDKLFPDYQLVIDHKVDVVQNEIAASIEATNKGLGEIIEKLTAAMAVADQDTGDALQYINQSEQALIEAIEKRKNASSTLKEYGKDVHDDYMIRYDEVLLTYQKLISDLKTQMGGIKDDRAKFQKITDGLSAQQTILNDFNIQVHNTSDVVELISLQENKFAELTVQTEEMLTKATETKRSRAAVDGIGVETVVKTGKKDLSALDSEVAEIKRKEIAKREEIARKKAEEERLKREAEERKKAEDQKRKQDEAVPSIFIRKSRGQLKNSEYYVEKNWNPRGKIKGSKEEELITKNEATTPIDGSKLNSPVVKKFFEDYKKVCDASLNAWYKKQNVTDPSKKLTSSMYVNAAKRIYLKYGDLKYIAPAELAMAQGTIESGLGLNGSNPYKNPYNVGETDKGPKYWVVDMTTPEIGIYFYMDLLAHDYLSKRTLDELLDWYVNEDEYRYAASPHYEVELKSALGMVGMMRDNRMLTAAVGKNKPNNDQNAVFVRGMLAKLNYNQQDLGAAILAFQKEKMCPPPTAKQHDVLYNVMSAKSRDQYFQKEKIWTDGVLGIKGPGVGFLYYLTYMGNSTASLFPENKSEADNKHVSYIYKYYANYLKSAIDVETLAKYLLPYCKYFASDVLFGLNKLDTKKQAYLSYWLALKSDDKVLKHFDTKLLNKMEAATNPAKTKSDNNYIKIQWERIKIALGLVASTKTTSAKVDVEKTNLGSQAGKTLAQGIQVAKINSGTQLVNPSGGKLRGQDKFGDGHYGASRDGGSRKHMGIDILTTIGQDLVSPVDGTATYVKGTKGTVDIIPSNKTLGITKIRLLYINSDLKVGTSFPVVAGQTVIGTAANLETLGYSKGMTPHTHVQVRKNDQWIDPTPYFFK